MNDQSIQSEAALEIRAFRGTRRSSVYRGHALTTRTFIRIRTAASSRGLSLISSLNPAGHTDLDQADALRLASEATELRLSAALPDLDTDLTAVTEIARWCAHAQRNAWLTIRPVQA